MQTVDEFAASIGRTVNTVNAWIYKHGLPVVRIGRRVYVREVDYEKWTASLVQVGNYRKHVEFIEVVPRPAVNPRIASKIQRIY